MQPSLIGLAARYNVALRDSEKPFHSAALLRLAGFAGFHVRSGRRAVVVRGTRFHVWLCMYVCISMCVCALSHLSWRAFFHRLDDGDPVFLLQGEAVVTFAWPYLGEHTAHHP